MRGQKELNEFINKNMAMLFIPKRYKNTTFEEYQTKEFKYNTLRSAMNFALAVCGEFPELKYRLFNSIERKHIVTFCAKGSEQSKQQWLTSIYKFRNKDYAKPTIDVALSEFTELVACLETGLDGNYYLRFEEQDSE